MATVTYNAKNVATLHLSARDRDELLGAVAAMGRAEALGRYRAARMHEDRIGDICFPTMEPHVRVVPIESLAPDTEA